MTPQELEIKKPAWRCTHEPVVFILRKSSSTQCQFDETRDRTMKFGKKSALLAFGGLTLMAQAVQAATYYVACTGKDTNVGSQASPWATLSKAGQVAKAADVVMLRAGCTWNETLKLNNGVRYQSFGTGAKPVITGSQPIGTLAWQSLPNNVWVADVSALVKDEFDMYGNKVVGGVSQLFLNGQRLTRARFPNVGNGGYAVAGSSYIPTDKTTNLADGFTKVFSTSNVVPVTGQTVASYLSGQDLVGADVFAKNNDWFMTRYRVTASGPDNLTFTAKADSWDGNDYVGDRKALHDLDWPGITNYPIDDGYGYWLEGKLWMLDAAGEWVYDPGLKKLYVRLPDNSSPVNKAGLTAAVRLHGISGFNLQKVDIDGLEVRETRGDAIKVDGFSALVSSIKINNAVVNNAGRKGINVINSVRPGATLVTGGVGAITNSTISNSINEGIDLSGDRHWADSRTQQINVTGNTVNNAGLGYYARGAILLGHRGSATSNQVLNASYIGILGGKLNTISGNTVASTCLSFDDCGAIYTNGDYYKIKDVEPGTTQTDTDVSSNITKNFVLGAISSNGRRDGSGASNGLNGGVRATNVVGIYLDDSSDKVTVSDNYVTGTDHGVLVHQGSYNTITGNNLVGNRRAIYLQKNAVEGIAMTGNLVQSNRMATSSGEPLVQLQNVYGSTAGLGTFIDNRYAALRSNFFAYDDSKGSATRLKTFAQWRASGRDSGVNATLHATSLSLSAQSGATAILNSGNFASGSTNGWTGWDGDPSVSGGRLVVSQNANTSDEGPFRRLSVSPPELFSITSGQRYWLTFTVQADAPGEVALQFRKPGAPYTDLSVPVVGAVGPTARSYSVLLTAGESNPQASLPFAFYLDKSVAGAKAYLSNVSLIAAAPVDSKAGAIGLYNRTAASARYSCPQLVSGSCAPHIDLKTGGAVAFPYTLGAASSVVLGVNVPAWLDTDRDGIPNGVDACSSTPDGVGVKENGCP
jgi:parallel beta-helix repeat protein